MHAPGSSLTCFFSANELRDMARREAKQRGWNLSAFVRYALALTCGLGEAAALAHAESLATLKGYRLANQAR